MTNLPGGLQVAARRLARDRGFTVIAVLSLAIAIALNTIMYSVLDALVNPRIDVQHPERVFSLTYYGAPRRFDQVTVGASLPASGEHYEAVTGYRALTTNIAVGDRRQPVSYRVVTPDFFDFLGVAPIQGRLFTDADASSSEAPVVVSERVVASLFPGSQSPLGAVIQANGVSHVIVGVVSRYVNFPNESVDLWAVHPSDGLFTSRLPSVLIRRRAGSSTADLEHELALFATRVALASGFSPRNSRFGLRAMADPQFHAMGFHYALIAAVLAVLMVACANLANLQLARGIGRSRELALRSALGASRRDIVIQLLIESGLITATGLVFGLLLTLWGIDVVRAVIPPSIGSYVAEPQTSWRMFAFALVTSALCVILIGLLPAIRASRVDPNELLKSGAGTGTHKRNRNRYGLLVICEIGLALVLLSGAAIVTRTALRVDQSTLGFDPSPLSAAYVITGPTSSRSVVATFSDLVTRARGMPDAVDAAVSMRHSVIDAAIAVDDPGQGIREIPAPLLSYDVVSPGYFRTFHRPIIAGRDFQEGESDVPAVIVSEGTARALWPNSNAVGSMIKLGASSSSAPWVRVVGVVGEQPGFEVVPHPWWDEVTGKTKGGDRSIYYLPSTRDALVSEAGPLIIGLIVRAGTRNERMPVTIETEFRNVNGTRVAFARTFEEGLGLLAKRTNHRFVAKLFSAFAALATALAALGIYGVVSHSVAERRREMGVRIALGATPWNILHAVLREGNAIALSGIALGLLLTKYGVRLLEAFSAQDDQYDATLFAAMGLALFAVTVVSALIPAVRATRIDPVESLRSE